jgi:hypothetical protein
MQKTNDEDDFLAIMLFWFIPRFPTSTLILEPIMVLDESVGVVLLTMAGQFQ